MEKTKKDISANILINHFPIKRKTFVVTNASGDGFAYILLQHCNGGYLVIQVGSAAIKKQWRNHSALKLEATCVTDEGSDGQATEVPRGRRGLRDGDQACARGPGEIEAVLNNLRGQGNYAYNRIISLVQGDISATVVTGPYFF